MLVNQTLLQIGVNDLDEVRHQVAETLMDFYQKERPAGSVAWLKCEVDKWIDVFSPGATRPKEGTGVSPELVESGGPGKEFRHAENYRVVWVGKQKYKLSWTQSLIVKFLHGRHTQGKPSEHEKEILAAIDEDSGSGSVTERNARRESVGKTRRVSNVFPRKDPRSALIKAEGNAVYRLNIPS